MCIGNSGSRVKTFAYELCITYFSLLRSAFNSNTRLHHERERGEREREP